MKHKWDFFLYTRNLRETHFACKKSCYVQIAQQLNLLTLPCMFLSSHCSLKKKLLCSDSSCPIYPSSPRCSTGCMCTRFGKSEVRLTRNVFGILHRAFHCKYQKGRPANFFQRKRESWMGHFLRMSHARMQI